MDVLAFVSVGGAVFTEEALLFCGEADDDDDGDEDKVEVGVCPADSGELSLFCCCFCCVGGCLMPIFGLLSREVADNVEHCIIVFFLFFELDF